MQYPHLSNNKNSDDRGLDDTQIMIWLWNNMKPQISSNIMFMTITKEIWDVLIIMCSLNKDLVLIFELFSKILSL